MSGIVGSYFNTRGSGVVAKLGTDGQLFTSAGAGVSQGFEAAAGGGAMTLIERQSQADSGVDYLRFDDVFSGTYDIYKLYILGGLALESSLADPIIRLLVGTTAQTGTYETFNHYMYKYTSDSNAIDSQSQTTGWMIATTFNQMNVSGPDEKKRYYHNITFYNPYQTDTYIAMNCQTVGHDRHASGPGFRLCMNIFGHYATATACDGFDYLVDNGQIQECTAALYGVNKT